VFANNGLCQTIVFTTATGTLPTKWCFETVNIKDANISFTVTNGTTGADGNDMMLGDGTAKTLNGGQGTDFIYGAAGADTLVGGLGKDFLQGGVGKDIFKFTTAQDTGLLSNGAADQIIDFTLADDKIALSAIDADPTVTGDQAFTFLGANAPTTGSGLGKVWLSGSNNETIVNISVNADANAEMQISLVGFLTSSMAASHFIL